MRNLFIGLFICLTTVVNPQNYTPTIEDYKIVEEIEMIDVFSDEQFLFEIFWHLIISFEASREKAYSDHDHYSYGWGTRAKNVRSTISLCEANKVSREAFKRRVVKIKRLYPNISLYKQYLMAAVEYNLTHDRWRSNLIQRVKTNDGEIIASSLIHYNKAGGKVARGLKIRREVESQYLLAEGNMQALDELLIKTQQRIIDKNGNIDFYACITDSFLVFL